MLNPTLTLENSSLPKERQYFLILALISSFAWIGIIISIIGPVFIILIATAIWFINGLFIAWIKSEGVKISEDQVPELHRAFLKVCTALGVEEIPALYVMQSDGMLNAFATRHSRRDFVVLYSDIVESYGTDSPEISFLLGHEIGHVRKKHIFKSFFLFPSYFIPLLWEAYNRACEATCDRHGAIAANDLDASIKALMILSGGKELGKKMNRNSFLDQYTNDRGFFVSCHELMSTYPTLSQRVYNMNELLNGREPSRSPRNLLAYPFSLFGSLFKNIFVIFILAAIIIGVYEEITGEEVIPTDKSSEIIEEETLENEIEDEPVNEDSNSDSDVESNLGDSQLEE